MYATLGPACARYASTRAARGTRRGRRVPRAARRRCVPCAGGTELAYILSAGGEFRRYETDAESATPLGAGDAFEPRLTRIPLEPGDLVLLASSRLDAVAPASLIQRVLERGADDALPELYRLCRDEQEFALVLLSCFEEADAPPAYLTRDGEPTAGAAADDRGQADASASAIGTLVPVAAGDAPPPAEASLAADIAGFDLPRRPIHEQVREITESTAPPPATGVRLRGDAAAPRYKRTTGSLPLPQFQVPRLALLAALALVIVGLLAWWQLRAR